MSLAQKSVPDLAPWEREPEPTPEPPVSGLEEKLYRNLGHACRRPFKSFDRMCREGYFFCNPCGANGQPATNYKHEGNVCPTCKQPMTFLEPLPDYAEAKARAEAQKAAH